MFESIGLVAEYTYIAVILITIILITFILLICMPKPKCYFDVDEICKELLPIIENEQLVPELMELFEKQTEKTDRTHHYIYNDNQVTIDTSSISTSYDLFRTIPNVRNILVVKLNGSTDISKKKGSATLSNNTLRCVLPLKISGAKKSGIWVDGETKFFTEGEWIIYDNSREHSVFNKHKRRESYILVIDIDRPDNIPLGISTEETDLII
jgi:hypothetical protein